MLNIIPETLTGPRGKVADVFLVHESLRVLLQAHGDPSCGHGEGSLMRCYGTTPDELPRLMSVIREHPQFTDRVIAAAFFPTTIFCGSGKKVVARTLKSFVASMEDLGFQRIVAQGKLFRVKDSSAVLNWLAETPSGDIELAVVVDRFPPSEEERRLAEAVERAQAIGSECAALLPLSALSQDRPKQVRSSGLVVGDGFFCPDCGFISRRAAKESKEIVWCLGNKALHDLLRMPLAELQEIVCARLDGNCTPSESRLIATLQALAPYTAISLDRNWRSLATSEQCKLLLEHVALTGIRDVVLVLDELIDELHEQDQRQVISIAKRIAAAGNIVCITTARSATAALVGQTAAPLETWPEEASTPELGRRRASAMQRIHLTLPNHGQVEFALRGMTAVTGRGGSGKTAFLRAILQTPAAQLRALRWRKVLYCDSASVGSPSSMEVVNEATRVLDSSGVTGLIAELFARTAMARERGFSAAHFRAQTKEGACENCGGLGEERTYFSRDDFAQITCRRCYGTGHRRDVLDVQLGATTLKDVSRASLGELVQWFASYPDIVAALEPLIASLGDLQKVSCRIHDLKLWQKKTLLLAQVLRKTRGTHALVLLDSVCDNLPVEAWSYWSRALKRALEDGLTVLISSNDPRVIAEADECLPMGESIGRRKLDESL